MSLISIGIKIIIHDYNIIVSINLIMNKNRLVLSDFV